MTYYYFLMVIIDFMLHEFFNRRTAACSHRNILHVNIGLLNYSDSSICRHE